MFHRIQLYGLMK